MFYFLRTKKVVRKQVLNYYNLKIGMKSSFYSFFPHDINVHQKSLILSQFSSWIEINLNDFCNKIHGNFSWNVLCSAVQLAILCKSFSYFLTVTIIKLVSILVKVMLLSFNTPHNTTHITIGKCWLGHFPQHIPSLIYTTTLLRSISRSVP